MLTVVLEDITNVMIAGHLVVIMTVLWLQRTVLKKLVQNRDQDIEVRRIAETAMNNKALSSDDNPEEGDEPKTEEETEAEEIVEVDELVEIVEEDSQQKEENWQDDSTIDWDKKADTISDNVEWNDDVIELDD